MAANTKKAGLEATGFLPQGWGTRVPGFGPGRIVGRDACLVSRLGGFSPPQGCVRHLFATHASTTISGMRFFARPCNDLPTWKQSRGIRQVNFKVSHGSCYSWWSVGISETGVFGPVLGWIFNLVRRWERPGRTGTWTRQKKRQLQQIYPPKRRDSHLRG